MNARQNDDDEGSLKPTPTEYEIWGRAERRLGEMGWSWADLHRATQSGPLAEKWGGRMSESRISKYRKKTGKLTVAHLVAMCEAMDITLDALVFGGESAPPRTRDEALLYDFVFGGPSPMGLSAALRLMRAGMVAEAQSTAQAGKEPPPPGPRASRPGPTEVRRGRPQGSGGKGKS